MIGLAGAAQRGCTVADGRRWPPIDRQDSTPPAGGSTRRPTPARSGRAGGRTPRPDALAAIMEEPACADVALEPAGSKERQYA